MSLTAWQRNGWLMPHQTNPEEIADWLNAADRDLDTCRLPGLGSDWRLNIAHNAALLAATAALAACGYEARKGEAHRYLALQSLEHTVGAPDDVLRRLDAFRKKRATSVYMMAGNVSDSEAQEMVRLAQYVRQAVELWLQREHPELR